MNRYTPEQLKDLFITIVNSNSFPYYLIKMFISDDSDFIENKIKVCTDDHIVYDRMRNYRWTKINGNFPNKEQKGILKKAFDIIFNIPLNKVPLHINETKLLLLVKWRLKNNI